MDNIYRAIVGFPHPKLKYYKYSLKHVYFGNGKLESENSSFSDSRI